MRRSRSAFSLLELVLVLGIIATLSTIAGVHFSRTNERFRVQLAAERLVRDLEYASVLARVRSAEVKIHFVKGDKPHESYYWFENLDDPDRPGTPYTVVLRQNPYNVVLTDASHDITFLFDGIPKDSRTFVVRASPGVTRSVLVDKDTGEITIQ